MKKQINLAVASAILAMGAGAAQAGITLPAGDWTVDINGNVNAYYIYNKSNDNHTIAGGLANSQDAHGNDKASSINTGLLPSWLGISAKTRQNDLDIGWTISFQPGASSQHSLGAGGTSEFRQAFITFGDKSWGTIKVGKDLGVFGSDAILNDMTLLGVGSQGIVNTQGGKTTTLGRIGTGYMYADFNGQINYTSPNWNGFDFTVGIDQPLQTYNLSSSSGSTWGFGGTTDTGVNSKQKAPAFVGKAGYSWGGDFAGKVWAEYKTQKVDGIYTSATTDTDENANMWGLGGKVGFSGFDLVGYYYQGNGAGTTAFLMDGFTSTGKKRDSSGGYVQGTYKIPGVGTKLGVSWGESKLDTASGDTADNGGTTTLVEKNEMWTFGAYHPLTKSLNLVAEYSDVKSKNQEGDKNKSNIFSLGAILFF